MWPSPIIWDSVRSSNEIEGSMGARGNSFIIYEWKGSGPPYIHVHYEDDEAWYILEGNLSFVFPDRKLEATKGTTVFVPAGLPHSYVAHEGSRYLIILSPRLDQLIAELHTVPLKDHAMVMKKYHSEILDQAILFDKPEV